MLALYIGGMGAKEKNFHKRVFDRMGYDDEAEPSRSCTSKGRKDEAAALVPDELIDEVTIIGDRDRVRSQVRRWAAAGVTMLLVRLRTPEEVRAVAEVVRTA